jgi:hypothetical protein
VVRDEESVRGVVVEVLGEPGVVEAPEVVEGGGVDGEDPFVVARARPPEGRRWRGGPPAEVAGEQVQALVHLEAGDVAVIAVW